MEDWSGHSEVNPGADEPDNLSEEDESEDSEVNPGAYQLDNLLDNGLEVEEEAGVLHLAHGWIQQGQPKKVSEMCTVFTKTNC